MNRRASDDPLRAEKPVWCDHCRLRIAPYEAATIHGEHAFHKHCWARHRVLNAHLALAAIDAAGAAGGICGRTWTMTKRRSR
jgi:hypothetical protein